MIKALFLDDEPLAIRQMELYAAKIPGMEVIASCTSAAKARNHVTEADVLFVDIRMPDISGLDFVRSLENPPLVVLTTAFAEYALDGFRLGAVDYLLKPFSFKDFSASVSRVSEILELRAAALGKDPSRDDSASVLLGVGRKVVRVPVNSIRYIRSMGEYIKVFRNDTAEPVVALCGISRLCENLPEAQFVRIHRTCAVAKDAIAEVSSGSVTIAPVNTPTLYLPAEVLPVGGNYAASLRSLLLLGRVKN